MKNKKIVWGIGLTAILLFSQGFTTVNAESHKGKGNKKKTHVVDKNKNGIADTWEKKYKLSGKNIAKEDKDKDGLTNLVEYQLNLNPVSSDSDKDKLTDGLEDSDNDQLSNISEIELGTEPNNPDTDEDHINDGAEVSKDGVEYSQKIRNIDIKLETSDKKMNLKYKYKKNHTIIKANYKTTTKEMITSLVSELETKPGLSEDEMIAIITKKFGLEDHAYNLEAEIEFLDGTKIKIEKELLSDKDDQDNNDEDHGDGGHDND
ncbi:hypothetical protein P4361_11775 [Fictibacillus sp. B-59209]|uniref:hypothetical protein n=1 Tax=Fictibacillus sp. B-59209 TaxID=3024873 RepID=UPI002E1A6A4D|nr:hypothetical protein [Fictibacillus sp. B-59209]